MSTESLEHITVLLNEAVDGLNIKADGIYVDCTFGRGGHSRKILQQLGDTGRLIAIDRDPEAINAAADIINDPRFTIVQDSFSNLTEITQSLGVYGQVDGILVDLGVSSPQLDDASRGFSFMNDGPLDMRMDPTSGISASEWLMKADAADIKFVLKEYGEERFAQRIANAIVERREVEPLTNTRQLAKLIDEASPFKDKHKHPATRSFQAIRIYINGELDEAEKVLSSGLDALAVTGRLSVISFHSLEDRLVKRFIRAQSQGIQVPRGLPVTEDFINSGVRVKAIGKAIKPSKDEVSQNPRSRSSILRVAEKVA